MPADGVAGMTPEDIIDALAPGIIFAIAVLKVAEDDLQSRGATADAREAHGMVSGMLLILGMVDSVETSSVAAMVERGRTVLEARLRASEAIQ
jgi:hypothetical protein